MSQLSQIYEGWKNNLLPPKKLEEQIILVSKERLAICDECPKHSKFHKTIRLDDHCTHCGCTLAAKTKCLSCACPLDKWKAVVTEEQEDQMLPADGKT